MRDRLLRGGPLSFRVVLGFLASMQPAGLALAHHGWSSYDQDRPLTYSGRVQKSGYEHPHGFVVIESQGRTLTVVLAPPLRMENRGLSRDAIAPGREVTVEGYALRSDPTEIRAERITVAGKAVELR